MRFNEFAGSAGHLAPEVSGGKRDPERFGFINLSVTEVEEDTRSFVQQLRIINPAVKRILTVSSLPLVATYEDRSVICVTSFSKSVLRVASENMCRSDPKVAYYPSFGIITGSFAQGRYFEDDGRSVAPDGVEHAMDLFLRHYGVDAVCSQTPSSKIVASVALKKDNALNDLIYEEEALDPDT